MNIFKQISQSVYNPEYYSNLRSEKTGSSVKYYIKFILLLAIVPTVFWTVTLFPFLKDGISSDNVTKCTGPLSLHTILVS